MDGGRELQVGGRLKMCKKCEMLRQKSGKHTMINVTDVILAGKLKQPALLLCSKANVEHVWFQQRINVQLMLTYRMLTSFTAVETA
jgi:hypothetical protein